MSVYSLAHVVDVAGWPTVWGIEVERWEIPAAVLERSAPEESLEPEEPALREEVSALTEELASITRRLKRLQLQLDA